MPRMSKIDPRKVGGRYFSGYWRDEYTVLELRPAGWLRVRWSDGHETVHATAWDPKRDRVPS